MAPFGSSYPDVLDALTVPVGTPHSSALLTEITSILLAVQRTIGVDVGNLTTMGLVTITDWNAAFHRRAQVELYTFTSTGTPGALQTINYQHVAKFTDIPHVFLFEDDTGLPASRVTGEGDTWFKVRCPHSTPTVVPYMAISWKG
ncbi:MAG: hypothetical protein HQ519_00050 [Planctomycetes bacterium]|nr:hypothetical protein [Planctomycetota bacterium]